MIRARNSVLEDRIVVANFSGEDHWEFMGRVKHAVNVAAAKAIRKVVLAAVVVVESKCMVGHAAAAVRRRDS